MTLPNCAVCGVPCRGTCKRCGTRLCHVHKPKTGKMKCSKCPRNSGNLRASSTHYYDPNDPDPYGALSVAQASYPSMPKLAPMPKPASMTPNAYYQPPQIAPDFENMSPSEIIQYAQERKDWLIRKKKRERKYLDGRAARGSRTQTDIDYEQDQPYEQDILYLLEYLIEQARQF